MFQFLSSDHFFPQQFYTFVPLHYFVFYPLHNVSCYFSFMYPVSHQIPPILQFCSFQLRYVFRFSNQWSAATAFWDRKTACICLSHFQNSDIGIMDQLPDFRQSRYEQHTTGEQSILWLLFPVTNNTRIISWRTYVMGTRLTSFEIGSRSFVLSCTGRPWIPRRMLPVYKLLTPLLSWEDNREL